MLYYTNYSSLNVSLLGHETEYIHWIGDSPQEIVIAIILHGSNRSIAFICINHYIFTI